MDSFHWANHWTENSAESVAIQSNTSTNSKEVGQSQPLISSDFQTPYELYLFVRELVAEGTFPEIRHPWFRDYPPLQALHELAIRQSSSSYRKPNPPFVPEIPQPLPIGVACQLALMWAILGYKCEASKLAAQLEPFVRQKFTSLWTPEREYNEDETLLSFALLLRALGYTEEYNRLYRTSFPKNQFFMWLFNHHIRIETAQVKSDPIAHLIQGDLSTIALCSHQNRAQLGALRLGNIHIPSFGPHGTPFSHSHLFGISDLPEKEGWFCSVASKETWFQLNPIDSQSLSLQSIGVDPDKPIYFVFYVRASECVIGDRPFKPQSLQRFSGEVNSVRFIEGEDRLEMATDRPLPIELIPLAGGDSFWGASFLLGFRVPIDMGRLFFSFHRV